MSTEVRVIIKHDSREEDQICPSCQRSYQKGSYIVSIVQDRMSWFDCGHVCNCEECGEEFICVTSYETVEQATSARESVVTRLERFHSLGILMLIGRYPTPSLHLH